MHVARQRAALANVDRTLLFLTSQGPKVAGDKAKDLELLTTVRDELLVTELSPDELANYADELWDRYGRQDRR